MVNLLPATGGVAAVPGRHTHMDASDRVQAYPEDWQVAVAQAASAHGAAV